VIDDNEQHFQTFASSLQAAIASHGYTAKGRVAAKAVQATQLAELIDIEAAFRVALAGDVHGRAVEVWTKFCEMVATGSVSQAQPYFRERQDVFVAGVAPLLKAGDAASLAASDFRVNRCFMAYAAAAVAWPAHHDVIQLLRSADAVRRALIELNLPLAVSRARIFSRSAVRPGSRLTFMDYVQTAAMGLIVAVDKFMPSAEAPELFAEACDVFPSVAITRMKGFFISSYSETSIHFSSADRRRLYRANKMMSAHAAGEIDMDDVVAAVNAGLKDGETAATADDIRSLIAAATLVSSDALQARADADTVQSSRNSSAAEGVVDPSQHPDNVAHLADTRSRLYTAVAELPLREQKVIRMYGLEVQ
jgi:RNA polymerase sigma factor (sigma-70 family)